MHSCDVLPSSLSPSGSLSAPAIALAQETPTPVPWPVPPRHRRRPSRRALRHRRTTPRLLRPLLNGPQQQALRQQLRPAAHLRPRTPRQQGQQRPHASPHRTRRHPAVSPMTRRSPPGRACRWCSTPASDPIPAGRKKRSRVTSHNRSSFTAKRCSPKVRAWAALSPARSGRAK